jgi:hypothetical protein
MTSLPLTKVGAMSRCPRSSQMLQCHLDGELDNPIAVLQVSEHLEGCRRCGLQAAVYRAIKQVLRSQGRDIDELALRRLYMFTRSLSSRDGGPEETG